MVGGGDEEQLLVALQICDTSFPSGSLANSSGLESAIAHGFVTRSVDDESNKSLMTFFRLTLEQTVRHSLPFVRAAHAAAELACVGERLSCVVEVDSVFSAFSVNEVFRRASLNQGKCFLRAAAAAFAHKSHCASSFETLAEAIRQGKLAGHYSVVFGVVCGLLGISVQLAERMLMRCALRDMTSCAARLNVLGPLEGANVQARLSSEALELILLFSPPVLSAPAVPSAKDIVARLLGADMPAQSSPVLDLLQARHDVLYTRLFSS